MTVLENKISTSGFVDMLETWDLLLRFEGFGLRDLFPVPGDLMSPEVQTAALNASLPTSSNIQNPDQTADTSNVRSMAEYPPERANTNRGDTAMQDTNTSNAESSSRLQRQTKQCLQPNDQDIATSDIRQLVPQVIDNPVTTESLINELSLGSTLFNVVSGTWDLTKGQRNSSADVNGYKYDVGEVLQKWRSRCPSTKAIFDMVHAVNEMYRIGEASFTFIQTPPSTAVWTIAFIRWCLGVEPYIRRQSGQRLVLEQSKSRILVEICEKSAKAFNVRTFKSSQGIQELLWASESAILKPVLWSGVMRIKTYFNMRLATLQTSYSLSHSELTGTFMHLALNRLSVAHYAHRWDAILLNKDRQRVRQSDEITLERDQFWAMYSDTPIPSNQVDKPDKLGRLLSMYFDIPNPSDEAYYPNISELHKFWANHPSEAMEDAIQLFLQIWLSSFIENVHYYPDPEVYIEVHHYFDAHPALRSYIYHYIRFPNAVDVLIIHAASDTEKFPDLERKILAFLGTEHSQAYARSSVASSSKGQTCYLSFLETLSIDPKNLLYQRVYPGWLQYEGQRYSYLSGESINHDLDLNKSNVSPHDISQTLFKQPSSEESFKWMVSIDDAHLLIYLQPYISDNASLDVRLSLEALERIKHLFGCLSKCAQLREAEIPVRYYRTAAAAILSGGEERLRVINCSANRVDLLYTAVAVHDIDGIVGVFCRNMCLACAIERAKQLMTYRSETAIIMI